MAELSLRTSRLFHEAGFQADGHAVHLAGDLEIAVHQADGLGLRSAFEHLRRPLNGKSLIEVAATRLWQFAAD